MDKKMNNYSGQFINKLVLVFILAMALGLTGCGGGGGGSDPAPTPGTTPTPIPAPNPTKISGGGIKGPLANAAVSIFAFDATKPGFKGAVETTASTDASAAITGLNLPLPLKPPYIMEFTSVPGETTDITTGALPVITTIRTVITQALLASGKDLYATPLTTLAVDIAVMNAAAGIQADEFEAALALAATKVVSTFGFGLDRSVDIFNTPPLINSATISAAEQANVAGYRTAVEAITAIAYQISQQSAGATADIVLADLAADLADNDIVDGSTGSTLNANSLQVLQQNPSSLPIPNTSPVQTIAHVQAILAAETAITGSTTATTKLIDGTIVTQTTPANTNADADGDGVLNADDAFPENATESVDIDGDGIGDNADPDDDNDGILDEDEDTTPAPTVTDKDGDGSDDGVDNCPINFNPTQTDTDGDTEGDACDLDDDGDGVDDADDAFPRDGSRSIDTDSDGIDDSTDTDDDNDGVLDINDTGNSPLDSTTACAVLIDCDGDGILDGADADPTDPNVGINFAPITNKDTVTVDEDAAVFLIDVTTNDVDDTIILTAFGANDSSLGTLTISGNSIQYTPIANAYGTDAFLYTVTDGTFFSQGSVTVTIVAVNDSPVSADDAVTTDEDTVVITGDVTANDFDVDGDVLTAALLTNASNGNVVDNGDGTFTFTPDPEFSGSDSFTYALSDNNGVVAAAAMPGITGTVHITVNPVNDNPVANADVMVTNEDTGAASVDVRLNDSDIDGDPLTVAAGDPVSTNGTVVNNNNGTFTYTPNANFNGSDSFSYGLSDGKGGGAIGTVNITVNPVNDNPVAKADVATTNEDTNVTTTDVRLNDTDVDGDVLTVEAGDPIAANGTVVNNDNGTFTYLPKANFNGSDSFSYTLSDGKGGSATGTVNITVNPVNNNPVANADSVTTNEDTGVTSVDVRLNDSDIDGDTLTVAAGDPVATNGTVVNNNNGTFSYTPNANFNGSDSFSYTLSDGNGGSATGTVNITVNPVNDNPVANADSVTTNEDTGVTSVDVRLNDTDVDGDTLTVVAGDSVAANGLVVNNNNGTFTYTPNINFNGTDSFSYTLSDGNGGSATGTVSITVAPINDNPVAVNDAITTNENTVVTTANVRLNDADVDGDTLTATLLVNASNGNVVDNNDGTFTYTPGANFNGVDSFTYFLSDGNGGAATGTVNITINPVNNAPVANTDTVITDEDTSVTSVDVRLNDVDSDNNLLTATLLTSTSNGSVVDNGNGTFTYTPDTNFNGADSFTYTLSDGDSNTADAIGTVNITVNPVNDNPVANADSLSTNEDVLVITADVTLNDTDIDDDTLTVAAGDPIATNGTVVNNNNGTFTYTPNANFNGSDSFSYTLSDGNGGSATGTVSITVNPVNDNPVANTDAVTTDEDVIVITADVTLNDTDIDGDTLTVVAGDPLATNGSVVNNNNGTFSYTPNANFNGNDSFSYGLSDGNGGSATGTVNITVNPVNNNPVAVNDAAITDEDTNVTTGNVILNDTDIDGDTLTVSAGDPIATNGTVLNNNNGTFTYSPNANFNGSDSFSYILSDGNGGSATGTVNITIAPVNDAPVATDDAVTTNEDVVVVTGNVILNDTDVDGDALSVAAGNPVATNGTVVNNNNGTFTYTPNANFKGNDSFTYTLSDGNGGSAIGTVNVTINSINDNPVANDDAVITDEDISVTTADVRLNDTDTDNDPLTAILLVSASNGSVVDNNNGTFSYTPNANFNGSDSFTYSLSDGNTGSATGTVNITVTPVNDAPVATDDAVTTNEDVVVTTGNVTLNDTDIDGDALSVVAGNPVATNGTVVNNNNGTFSYTPNANFNGSDSFVYTLSDGKGSSALGTVNITINPVSDNPVAINDTVITDEDVAVITSDVRLNDSDADGDALTATLLSNASNGNVVDNNNGTFSYTPSVNFNGSDSFTYTLSDGNTGTATGTVNITVNSVNDLPVGNADSFTVGATTATILDVLANDTDVDGTLTILNVSQGSRGSTVTHNGSTITFTDINNTADLETFTYDITDGTAIVTGINVTVTIIANIPPVTIADSATTDEDTAVLIANVLTNDNDGGDGPGALSVSGADLLSSNGGSVVNHGNGTFTYTPAPDFNGIDTFTYTVSDTVSTSVGTVSITVNPVNDAPVAVNDIDTVAEDTPLTTINVLTNDTDVENNPLSVLTADASSSAGGTVVNNGNGTFNYTPPADFNGIDEFSYTVTDGLKNATGLVSITVTAVNDVPVANDDNVTTVIDTTVVISNVFANDTDADGDTLVLQSNTAPANGSVIYNGGGTFTYLPDAGFLGTDSFTYTATDSVASAVATVTITVIPPGTPIDIVTLMSAAEGGVAGIENAETNVYAYWTDNYDPVNTVFLSGDKVYNHLSGVFDTVVNNGDLLLSGTQWASEGDIIGTDDGNGGLDLTIHDANNTNVEVASFKLTARYLDLSNLPIIDHLNTVWRGAMIRSNETFKVGAKLITDYRVEALVESHILGQDNSCQKDGTTKFADLNDNCNSVAVDTAINTTGYAQLLNEVVATAAWVDPNNDFTTPPGAVTIATNYVTNKTLMVQFVNGGAANYYEVNWNSKNALAFVANAVAGPDWVQNTDPGVEMIHFQVPASFITQFSDDLNAGLNYFLTVQNGFVRQGLKHAIGDVEFSDGQFNGNALNDILTNFSAPVIPGLAELTGTWLSSVISDNGDSALIHIFTNGNYESSGSCDLDGGSTGMEYGTVSVSADGSTTDIIAIAQVATQGLCGPGQGTKTLAVNGDVLTLSESGFDIVYNRLLGTLNPIVGSWLLGNIQDPGEEHMILTVLDDTTFMLSQDCTTTDSVSGFEYGTYVWDQGNNDLTGTLLVADSNGSCGLHDNTALSISGFTVTVVDDALTLTDTVGGGVFTFTRISPAYVIPMIQVVYTLDNLMMFDNVQGDEGEQITGSFTWSYVDGDFAGGSGQFTDLTIPGYGSNIAALTIKFDIQVGIEITLTDNVHNNGVTINLDFDQPLSSTLPSPINLVTSAYEIEIGARAGTFLSGAISPQVAP